MGQYWMIAVPQIFEVMPGRGKLGEILFDGSPEGIVEFLAVSVRPEETTIVETRVANTDGNHAGCTDTTHKHDKTEDADDKSRNVWQVKLAAKSAFSELPTELHNLVFNNLAIKDVVSLSLTSRYFWAVGRDHIQAEYASCLGPWAGKKIVCVGDYVEPGDYPPGLFSRELQERLRQNKDEQGHPWTLYHYTDEEYAFEVKVRPPLEIFREIINAEEWRALPRSDRSLVRDMLSSRTERFYPRDQPWILRNLTAKEFVRSEAIALKPEYIHGPNIKYLGFGEVVLSRICWSTDPSVSMDYDGGIHRGIWAGHSFDITTLARHREKTKSDEWKDVSEEVAREIADIWESEFGSDWRETICEPLTERRW